MSNLDENNWRSKSSPIQKSFNIICHPDEGYEGKLIKTLSIWCEIMNVNMESPTVSTDKFDAGVASPKTKLLHHSTSPPDSAHPSTWLMISHTFLPISSFTHLRRRTIFFAQRNNLNDNKIFTSNMSWGHFPILLSSYELVRDQAMWKGINRFVLKKLWKMSAGFALILFCSWWSRGCIMETIFYTSQKDRRTSIRCQLFN